MLSFRLVALCGALVLCAASVARAGDLNPPGAPSSSMKTLDEVEARIPVGPLTTPGDLDSVYTISQPGSYYLTGDVLGVAAKSGIKITSNNVFLDLNGFTLQGVPGALSGIRMSSYRRHGAVRNGSIQGWPGNGIEMRLDFGLVSDVQIADCGRWGIDCMSTFMPTIERVAISTCGTLADAEGGGVKMIGRGIVRDCALQTLQGAGIDGSVYASIRNCAVLSITPDAGANQSGFGIAGLLVESCTVDTAEGVGIAAPGIVRGCVVVSTVTEYNAPNLVDSF